jgi:hypothetical protein
MKKKSVICLFIILILLLPNISATAKNITENDLRGQWVFTWTLEDGETPSPLILYVNNIQPGQEANTYLAAGCMLSPNTDAMYPLALWATYSPAENTYDLSIYSTLLPADEAGPFGPPFIFKFSGIFEVKGSGVADDLAYGDFQSGGPIGTWRGSHHDRRQSKCPAVDTGGERLNMDVSAHIDLDNPTEGIGYQVEANGINIVASALKVTTPDGEVIIVPYYTDIWSPDADFVDTFRFGQSFDGVLPISGLPYQFVLLDIFGNPIPGTETQDTWTHCGAAGPTDFNTSPNPGDGQDILLSWAGIPDVEGEFVPGVTGYFQFGIHPWEWDGSEFGADFMAQTNHLIPWNSFTPGDKGTPDGRNVGVSLSEFADGSYLIDVGALYDANPAYGGFGHECMVGHSSQTLLMEKVGDTLSFSIFNP